MRQFRDAQWVKRFLAHTHVCTMSYTTVFLQCKHPSFALILQFLQLFLEVHRGTSCGIDKRVGGGQIFFIFLFYFYDMIE